MARSKTSVDRIRWHTRKCAQFSRIPIAKRRPGSLRYKRLVAYKTALTARLLAERAALREAGEL